MRYFIVAVRRAPQASAVKKTKTTTTTTSTMKRCRQPPACPARMCLKLHENPIVVPLAESTRAAATETDKGGDIRREERRIITTAKRNGKSCCCRSNTRRRNLHLLPRQHRLCALSFIKPVRRVFNLKLLLEDGRKERGAGKNVGVPIRENSSKLDHVLEK